jgi:hypothetical protein
VDVGRWFLTLSVAENLAMGDASARTPFARTELEKSMRCFGLMERRHQPLVRYPAANRCRHRRRLMALLT